MYKCICVNVFKFFFYRLMSKLPEDQHAAFKAQAQKAVQFILSKFDDWQFFQGNYGF